MQIEENGSVIFEGLPKEFVYALNNFTDEELKTNPLVCLSAAIREREREARMGGYIPENMHIY